MDQEDAPSSPLILLHSFPNKTPAPYSFSPSFFLSLSVSVGVSISLSLLISLSLSIGRGRVVGVGGSEGKVKECRREEVEEGVSECRVPLCHPGSLVREKF